MSPGVKCVIVQHVSRFLLGFLRKPARGATPMVASAAEQWSMGVCVSACWECAFMHLESPEPKRICLQGGRLDGGRRWVESRRRSGCGRAASHSDGESVEHRQCLMRPLWFKWGIAIRVQSALRRSNHKGACRQEEVFRCSSHRSQQRLWKQVQVQRDEEALQRPDNYDEQHLLLIGLVLFNGIF